jgi:hypothetical protein
MNASSQNLPVLQRTHPPGYGMNRRGGNNRAHRRPIAMRSGAAHAGRKPAAVFNL